MNENIDLTKILKDCPKGWEFYSSCLNRKVPFYRIERGEVLVKVGRGGYAHYGRDGSCFAHSGCCLFPSEEQRDWSMFTAPWYKREKFDPKTLKPFDKVLVWHYVWTVDLFSHHNDDNFEYPYVCIGGSIFSFAIPYNDETKHLAGTEEEAPEFYRYWED